ncbi:MAG: hypothetical protein GXP31_00620 [Kiritimatiellaeota bacterium]|nr:hypothetical protein [Kiritimatiellota bacterium]
MQSIRLRIRQLSAVLGPAASLALGAATPHEGNLLQCPGFEVPPQAWHAHGAPGRYRIAPRAGRNGGHALQYSKQAGTGEARENSHFDQIVAVRPNTLYVAGAWFRSETGLRPVLRLADMDWQTLRLAQAPLCPDWREVRVMFDSGRRTQVRFQIFGGSLTQMRESGPGTSFGDDCYLRRATPADRREFASCRVRVTPQQVVRRINPLIFGANFLFMVDTDAALADGRVAEALRGIPCRLLRFPGGDVADNYHWKTHTLDNPKWWPTKQGPDTTDTDEFMAFRRKVGADAILVVDLESGFVHDNIEAAVQEAAAWVEYCNRQKGYGVRYWEIGNETYLYNPGPKRRHKRVPVSARQYARAYLRFSRAMKAVDSSIKVGAVGPISPDTTVSLGDRKDTTPWWPTVLDTTRDELDFVVVHQYFRVPPNAPLDVARGIIRLRAFLETHLPDRRIEIALTEWNINKTGKLRGVDRLLTVAEAVGEFLRGGVDLACFWPMRFRSKVWRAAALLDIDTGEPLPAYRALQVFASSNGTQLVECRVSNPMIYACATVSATDGELVVFLINRFREGDAVTAEIATDGAKFAHARAVTLHAPSKGASGILSSPAPVDLRNEYWICRLPPQSLTRIRLSR